MKILPSAEKQSVYSTAPANLPWVSGECAVTQLKRSWLIYNFTIKKHFFLIKVNFLALCRSIFPSFSIIVSFLSDKLRTHLNR